MHYPAGKSPEDIRWPSSFGELPATLRVFTEALQACGVGDVIGPDRIEGARAIDDPDHTCAIQMQVCVDDERRWHAAVAVMATAVRTVPGVTMVVRLERISELEFDVAPWVPAPQRSRLLSAALQAAAATLPTGSSRA
jgi:hypothetical protein